MIKCPSCKNILDAKDSDVCPACGFEAPGAECFYGRKHFREWRAGLSGDVVVARVGASCSSSRSKSVKSIAVLVGVFVAAALVISGVIYLVKNYNNIWGSGSNSSDVATSLIKSDFDSNYTPADLYARQMDSIELRSVEDRALAEKYIDAGYMLYNSYYQNGRIVDSEGYIDYRFSVLGQWIDDGLVKNHLINVFKYEDIDDYDEFKAHFLNEGYSIESRDGVDVYTKDMGTVEYVGAVECMSINIVEDDYCFMEITYLPSRESSSYGSLESCRKYYSDVYEGLKTDRTKALLDTLIRDDYTVHLYSDVYHDTPVNLVDGYVAFYNKVIPSSHNRVYLMQICLNFETHEDAENYVKSIAGISGSTKVDYVYNADYYEIVRPNYDEYVYLYEDGVVRINHLSSSEIDNYSLRLSN